MKYCRCHTYSRSQYAASMKKKTGMRCRHAAAHTMSKMIHDGTDFAGTEAQKLRVGLNSIVASISIIYLAATPRCESETCIHKSDARNVCTCLFTTTKRNERAAYWESYLLIFTFFFWLLVEVRFGGRLAAFINQNRVSDKQRARCTV